MNNKIVGATQGKFRCITVAVGLALGVASVAHATTSGLTDNRDYNNGPLLADWSSQNYIYNGVSTNYWEDTSAAFVNNSVTYTSGIGMRDTAFSAAAGFSDWWLGGTYTNFTGTVRVDSLRSSPFAGINVELIGDGNVLATASLGYTGSATFNNVNVTGVKLLRLQAQGSGWGGQPQDYVFWSQANVAGRQPNYYNDTLTAGTSSAHPELGNSVAFLSAQNQPGGAGTSLSVNTWLDNSQSLKVNGQAVQGIGFSAPQFGLTSTGSVAWALSAGNGYQLFTFDLARDDRWTGATDQFLSLLVNGVSVASLDANALTSVPVTYSYLLSGATNVTFLMTGSGWGGASKPYIDITDAEFIAPIPEPSTLLLFAVGGAILCRSRKRK